jgi:hypothetical protein
LQKGPLVRFRRFPGLYVLVDAVSPGNWLVEVVTILISREIGNVDSLLRLRTLTRSQTISWSLVSPNRLDLRPSRLHVILLLASCKAEAPVIAQNVARFIQVK